MQPQTFSFSDSDLKYAAKLACKAWYKTLPSPEECVPHSFSDTFVESMNSLANRVKRDAKNQLYVKRFIAALIALIVGMSLWLAFDTNARAAVSNWFKEIFGTTVFYHFTENVELTELPNYELSFIPKGFEEKSRFQTSDAKSLFFAQPNSEKGFIFEYYLLSKNKHIQVGYDKNLNHEKVQIKNLPADYYAADETSETNTLIWFDESYEIIFIISSNLEKSVILSIADNVFLCKATN